MASELSLDYNKKSYVRHFREFRLAFILTWFSFGAVIAGATTATISWCLFASTSPFGFIFRHATGIRVHNNQLDGFQTHIVIAIFFVVWILVGFVLFPKAWHFQHHYKLSEAADHIGDNHPDPMMHDGGYRNILYFETFLRVVVILIFIAVCGFIIHELFVIHTL